MQAKLNGKARKGFEIPINRLIKQKLLMAQVKREQITRRAALFTDNAEKTDKIKGTAIF